VQSGSTCSSLTGRDPLAYAQRKIDVAAVASVMKAYFRELTVPLFPTDKYKAFIECTREWVWVGCNGSRCGVLM